MTHSPDERRAGGDPAREAALRVVERLVEAGHEAYFAGGCVRDRLMGLVPDDYDVATDARPEQVQALFRRAHHVGESFGVTLVRSERRMIEVATFRTDGVYSDGRHPDSVEFSDARHDAARRDFTINGLFEDPIAERIIDYVGGQIDIRDRRLRAIGDPRARLREDRLRMLRAVRFAARFDLAIDPETADAIRAGAAELTGVSRERVGHEMRKMLDHRNRAVAAWELQYLGLDAPVLGEPHQTVAPLRVGRLPDSASFTVALAAWLLDRHDGVAPDEADAIARRWADGLVLSNEQRRAVREALAVSLALAGPWPSLGVARQKRLAAGPHFRDALMLLQAADRARFVDVRRQVETLEQSGLTPPPLITGEDLIGAGLDPGPSFKQILDAVYDAQLEGWLEDRDGAVDLALTIARTVSEEPD
ncbi:MAG: CCA tRNA nucleotidyltransferase [Planctomycetota bacterium]|jgi:tRNA nucleotidyltransferase/poly(A) polymerase